MWARRKLFFNGIILQFEIHKKNKKYHIFPISKLKPSLQCMCMEMAWNTIRLCTFEINENSSISSPSSWLKSSWRPWHGKNKKKHAIRSLAWIFQNCLHEPVPVDEMRKKERHVKRFIYLCSGSLPFHRIVIVLADTRRQSGNGRMCAIIVLWQFYVASFHISMFTKLNFWQQKKILFFFEGELRHKSVMHRVKWWRICHVTNAHLE